ncbi:KH domain-containing protein HEN4 isoform X1 [Tanacetum coccineum]
MLKETRELQLECNMIQERLHQTCVVVDETLLCIEELNKSLNGCQRVVVLVTVQGIKRENTHLLEYPAAKVERPNVEENIRRLSIPGRYAKDRKRGCGYAIPCFHSAEVGVEPGAPIIGRLLVHLRQIGCLWGKGGMIIAEMRRVTGASIYIFPREHVAKYGMPSHEVVQDAYVRFSSFSWLHNRDHMKLSWNDWLSSPFRSTSVCNGLELLLVFS